MNKPMLRAEGIVLDSAKMKVLVQCDMEESFYRFPGGAVEFRETAVQAIERELIEEFDLPVVLDELAVINESIIEYDDKQRHDCTLIHWCHLNSEETYSFPIQHKERHGIILTWKSIKELHQKQVYPEGILEVIRSKMFNKIHHITTIKSY
ncbi:NUDIX domain-containing protein [Paenibacillus sp. HJGM_3]|uniref:NUDIX domain-containing protein n=1 Tax=Paenibacillus sp. HJGM_3 TaxID=3379816 RepID=UPI003858B4A6